MPDNKNLIWLRQDGETSEQYNAFTYFLNMPLPRTLNGAYRNYMSEKGHVDVNNKQASGTWRKWQNGYVANGKRKNVEHTWKKRVAAYDNHMSLEFTDEQQRMRTYETKREIKTTDKLLTKFNQMLANFELFATSSSTTQEDSDDGKSITKIVETIGLNVEGLEKLVKISGELTKQRRLALHMVDRITESQIANKEGQEFKIDAGKTLSLFETAKSQLAESGHGVASVYNNNDLTHIEQDSLNGA